MLILAGGMMLAKYAVGGEFNDVMKLFEQVNGKEK